MTHRLRIILSLLMLLAAPIGVCCQVNFCYQFDDCAGNSRPAGWGALPNLDFNYVGVLAYDNPELTRCTLKAMYATPLCPTRASTMRATTCG